MLVCSLNEMGTSHQREHTQSTFENDFYSKLALYLPIKLCIERIIY